MSWLLNIENFYDLFDIYYVFFAGDEAYPCDNTVITPIRRDRIQSERQLAFNKAHKSGRVLIEHTFGMLKKRFPALLYEMRSRKLENVQALSTAAVIVHNIAINHRDTLPILPNHVSQRRYEDLLRNTMFNTGQQNHSQRFELRNKVISMMSN